ncbi:MAG: chemotaxis protein CheW [Bacillota bacterium]
MAISQFVVFKISNESFALDVSNIGSISGINDITSAPDSPDYVEGVMNLRGDIIPVINLAKRFNIDSDVKIKDKRVIVIEIENKLFGFLVDDASKAIQIDTKDIADTPSLIKGNDGDYIDGICKVDNDILLLINLEKVLSHEEVVEIKSLE